jgi:hypothetical protein
LVRNGYIEITKNVKVGFKGGIMIVRNTVTVVLLAFLVGCGESGDDDIKETAKAVTDKAKTSADHVWSAQVKALDKAKGVEKTLMDAAQQQRQAIDSDSK